MNRKYALRNKKLFTAFISLLTILIISTGIIVNAGTTQTQNIYKTIRIVNGDTLWEIASEHAQNSDPRAYIYEIKKLNQLEGDIIFEGQELYLPE